MHGWEDFSWNYLFLLAIFATSTAQARRKKKLQDLLKMSRKVYRKENTTCEWDDGAKVGNKNK